MMKTHITKFGGLGVLLAMLMLFPKFNFGQCTVADTKLQLDINCNEDFSFSVANGSGQVTSLSITLGDTTFTQISNSWVRKGVVAYAAKDTARIQYDCKGANGHVYAVVVKAVFPDPIAGGLYGFTLSGSVASPYLITAYKATTPSVNLISYTAPTCETVSDGTAKIGVSGPDCAYMDITVNGVTKTVKTGVDSTWTGLSGSVKYPITAVPSASSTCICEVPSPIITTQQVLLPIGPKNNVSLACTQSINVSLSSNCEFRLPASLLMPSDDKCANALVDSIVITDAHGKYLTGSGSLSGVAGVSTELALDVLDGYKYLGKKLNFEVHSVENGKSVNYCWGNLNVEDKSAPELVGGECGDTISVACDKIGVFDPKGLFTDCSGIKDVITVQEYKNTCLPKGFKYSSMVTRVYYAIDKLGNKSERCTIAHAIDTFSIDSFKIVQGGIRACYDTMPAPVDTSILGGGGVPILITSNYDTIRLYPTSLSSKYPSVNTLLEYCGISASYEDRVITTSLCNKKVMRTWKIDQWTCHGDVDTRTLIQQFIFMDTLDPVLKLPIVKQELTTNTVGCGKYTDIYVPVYTDQCDPDFSVNATVYDKTWTLVSTATDINKSKKKITYDIDTNWVVYKAIDGCGNYREDTACVIILDKTKPVAICHDKLQASIGGGSGNAIVMAARINDGSYDDCYLHDVYVRRMDGGPQCNGPAIDSLFQDTFGKAVEFCCNDVGKTLMVQLRAVDANGNYNECMTEVEVVDKRGIDNLICPPSMTIRCGFNFGGDFNIFGFIRSESNREAIKVDKNYLIKANGDLRDGYYIGGCDKAEVFPKNRDDRNNCGLGVVRREFTLQDGNSTKTCTQVLTFERDLKADSFRIIYPDSIVIVNECTSENDEQLKPENTGEVIAQSYGCAQLLTNYEDQIFKFKQGEGDACFKILRTWKILDWCAPDQKYIIKEWVQVIKVIDNGVPVIDPNSLVGHTAVITDGTCDRGLIELGVRATDNCTPDSLLIYEYVIDEFNDGVLDDAGRAKSIQKRLPVGRHRIIWTVRDICNNTVRGEEFFTIYTDKPPTPICHPLATSLMPFDSDNNGSIDAGMIEIWADDFDESHKSFHPCGYKVVKSFTTDIKDRANTFTCNQKGLQSVRIYVTAVDSAGLPIMVNGKPLQDFCTTTITVSDNFNLCPNAKPVDTATSSSAIVRGRITADNAAVLENVEVSLGTSGATKTGKDGKFTFPGVFKGSNLLVRANYETEAADGLSTLDILLLQKHILGVKNLESEYKIIAADVNGDEQVNITDIIEMRKLVLGIHNKFSTGKTWKFIDASMRFTDKLDPFANKIAEGYQIRNLSNDMNLDLIGLKYGDLDNSNAQAAAVKTRSTGETKIAMVDQKIEAGQTFEMNLKTTQKESINGFQFTLDYDPTVAEFVGISSTSLDPAQLHYHRVETGLVNVIYTGTTAKQLSANANMMSLTFKANANKQLSSVVNINSRSLNAEIYTEKLETKSLQLEYMKESSDYVLYQNSPNPFTNITEISFSIPRAGEANLALYDVTGRVLKSVTANYSKGTHTLKFSAGELQATGVIYYTLKAGNFTDTKKMVILK